MGCPNCHKFTAADEKTARLVLRLRQLAPGEMARTGSLKWVGQKKYSIQNDCGTDDKRTREWVEEISSSSGSKRTVSRGNTYSAAEHAERAEHMAKRIRIARDNADLLEGDGITPQHSRSVTDVNGDTSASQESYK